MFFKEFFSLKIQKLALHDRQVWVDPGWLSGRMALAS
jgi:hypothetical protein